MTTSKRRPGAKRGRGEVTISAKRGTARRPASPDADFAGRLIAWQRRHGRHDLPWQGTTDAYRIWLSEIMLQQTQVATVIPYYRTFLARFPDVGALAAADIDDVLRLWAGLGYYSRARNLHRAAVAVVQVHGGDFPREREALESLPGVGRSTAAAIAAFAFGAREAILDGNVKRALARHFAVAGFPGESRVMAQLWATAEGLLPARGIERYTQALMDLGATVCTRSPDCSRCPVQATCAAFAANAVKDYPAPRPKKVVPVRELRMLLLEQGDRLLLEKRPSTGIWGGLYSFPEFALDEDLAASSRERLGYEIEVQRELSVLTHGFTHYTLRIHPVVCRLKGAGGAASLRAGEPQSVAWMSRAEIEAGAVPAPVKALLGLASGQSGRQAPLRRRARSVAKEKPAR